MYGAMAAVGFFAGIFCGGASAELLSWRWYFYIGAILSLMSFLIAFLSIPSMIDNYTASAPSSTSDMISCPSTREKRFDWQGILLIVSGLILVIYAITDFSHAPRGWRTPYISATFCSGLFLLAVAAWWELWRLPVLRLEIETRLGEERNCRLSKYRQGAACASGSVADQEADKLRRSRDHADPVTVDSWAILPVEFLRGKAGLQAVLAAMFFQYGALGVYLLYGAE